MNVLYCYIFVWKRSQVMSGIRKTYSLSSVERDHQSNERKTQSSAHESEEPPLAFCICKELWSRWHLHCLDMTWQRIWHRIELTLAQLYSQPRKRIDFTNAAGLDIDNGWRWRKKDEVRQLHMDRTVLYRERDIMLYSHLKNRTEKREKQWC